MPVDYLIWVCLCRFGVSLVSCELEDEAQTGSGVDALAPIKLKYANHVRI